MKAYTDLSQSKKLAEILPLESADMCYVNDGTAIKIDANSYSVCYSMWKDCVVQIIPCWSLAALINTLPASIVDNRYFLEISKMGDASKPNEVRYYRFREDRDFADFGRITRISYLAENLVDACVNMILHLKERNLI